jgi:hypothetical protein
VLCAVSAVAHAKRHSYPAYTKHEIRGDYGTLFALRGEPAHMAALKQTN